MTWRSIMRERASTFSRTSWGSGQSGSLRAAWKIDHRRALRRSASRRDSPPSFIFAARASRREASPKAQASVLRGSSPLGRLV